MGSLGARAQHDLLPGVHLLQVPFADGAYLSLGTRGLLGATFEATRHAVSGEPALRALLGDPADLATLVVAEGLATAYLRARPHTGRLVLALALPRALLDCPEAVRRLTAAFAAALHDD